MIPFRTTIDSQNGLYGETELSEKDSKELLSRKLRLYSMKGKTASTAYFLPAAHHNPAYQAFLTQTKTYTLQELAPDMPVQRGQPNKTKFLYKNNLSGKMHAISLLQVYTG
jgi:hypothetical protein